MFGDKNERHEILGVSEGNREVSTVLDKEASFEGKMTFEGTVIINGKFKGEISSSGNLIIGESGVVEGQVEIGRIQVQGQVRGNIVAKQKIEINSPAVIQGDISAPSLVIKEGAIFEGNCGMGRHQNVVDLNTKHGVD